MIRLLLGTAIVYFLQKQLSEFTNRDITEFSKDDIITDYAKFFSKNERRIAKIHATKTINKLINENKKFKIGKTGSPKDRNSKHKKFNMYIIIESKNKNFVNTLEAHYNEKFIKDKNNMNYKIGSAGEMTGKTGRYFLYFLMKI